MMTRYILLLFIVLSCERNEMRPTLKNYRSKIVHSITSESEHVVIRFSDGNVLLIKSKQWKELDRGY